MICFGWCNSKMLDDAPERQIEESVSPEAEKILLYLKSANETHREYTFFEKSFFLGARHSPPATYYKRVSLKVQSWLEVRKSEKKL